MAVDGLDPPFPGDLFPRGDVTGEVAARAKKPGGDGDAGGSAAGDFSSRSSFPMFDRSSSTFK
ncbi:MAG: hypothetical protein IMX05_10290 [Hydrogenibacillus schlegelii]|nr:hypothetical protein [Hydrogenibacillus schlegelii]